MSSSKKSKQATGRRTRGTYTPLAVVGAGTDEDPKITWLIARPKTEAGDAYEQIVRDVASMTGLKAWFIRSLVHKTTTTKDRVVVQDDPHFTVFADEEAGKSEDEDFQYQGHVYVALDEDGVPRRGLHPEEFEWEDDVAAPVVLYDPKTYVPKQFYFKDAYFDYYDGYGEDEEVEEEEVEEEEVEEEEVEEEVEGREASKSKDKKKKRKWKREGKGKARSV